MADTKKTKSFTSAMTGAPVLSGTAGALIAVLDAVLVNGFGLGTLTSLVVSGNVATATYGAGHPFTVGSVALIAGATPAGLNGEQRILSTAANTVTFATTGISDQTATGTITSKVAPAGWSKLYTGTNLAAYKITSVMGTGCILKVDDTGTTTARVRGFEAMSDISTGTGPFPTVAQIAAPGLWWSKSNAASAAARPWRIVADDRGVYFFPKNADTASEHQGNYFGDILPIKSGDPYACVLRANSADRSASVTAMVDSLEYADSSSSAAGTYVARAANTLGGSVQSFQAPVMSIGLAAAHVTGAVGLSYPSPVDNGLLLTPVCVYSASGYRGYFPGLRFSPQITNSAFSTGDVVAGSGDMVGKSVTIIKLGTPAAGGGQGVVFMDQTSDWR
jgi:hypothetical protein